MDDSLFITIQNETSEFLGQPNAYRSVLILVAAIIGSYFASKFLAGAIVRLAQIIGTKSDAMTNSQRQIRYRQIETYLSIAVAIVRAVVVAVVAYITWRLLTPASSSSAAAIGASAFFIVVAGQTLGPVLRDITAGAAMITEGWFHVGDYIKIEPFIDMAGVVERFTLRSTKLRSLSGEAIWVHNQQIHAVHVTRNAARMYVVDIFTHEPSIAQAAIQEVIDAVPSNSAMVRNPIKIGEIEKWDKLWHIVVHAKTAPGREWLIETFFVNALKQIDENKPKDERIFAFEPMARFADPRAEKEFKRSIR
ncbi:MAG TPA: mechanosensitive ion channel family protein [Candidatus Saccharimonadales bacterium]